MTFRCGHVGLFSPLVLRAASRFDECFVRARQVVRCCKRACPADAMPTAGGVRIFVVSISPFDSLALLLAHSW